MLNKNKKQRQPGRVLVSYNAQHVLVRAHVILLNGTTDFLYVNKSAFMGLTKPMSAIDLPTLEPANAITAHFMINSTHHKNGYRRD